MAMDDPARPDPLPDSAGTPPAAAPALRRRWRRPLAWGLALLAAGLVLLAVGLRQAWHSPSSLPWLLQQVPGLQVQGLRGSLDGSELTADRIDWTLPGGAGTLQIERLAISGLEWQAWWRPEEHGGAWASMTIRALRASAVTFRSGAPAPQKPSAPTSLRLPIALQVGDAVIDRLQVDALPSVRAIHAALKLGTAQGTAHELTLAGADLENAHVEGRLRVGADAPLQVAMQLQARSIQGAAWRAQAGLAGPVGRLHADAELQGEARGSHAAPSAKASATLQPWAAWPLADLRLQTRQLDLASLSAHWPETSLDGEATVDTSGLERPGSARVGLNNTRPGRHDLGRLPIKRLIATLSALPRQPDHVDIQSFEMLLADGQADAGRITGQGQWREGALDLALQVSELAAARLDAREAALRVSGTVGLKATGLSGPASAARASVQGRLTGQATDGSGLPMLLQIDADAGADHLLLRQAEASAGTARAALTGEARHEAAGWHVVGKGRLEQFDPRPWWRGSPGSAWSQGPHRFSGQLDADLLWRGTLPPGDGVPWERWLQQLAGKADLTVAPSVLAGVPVSGEIHLASQANGVRAQAELQAGGNSASISGLGGLGAGGRAGSVTDAADHWQVKAQAPRLATLGPLLRLVADLAPDAAPWLPSAGQVDVDATLDGRWPDLRSAGRLQAQGWRSPSARVDRADATWQVGQVGQVGQANAPAPPTAAAGQATPPLSLDLRAQGLEIGGQRIDRIEGKLSGTSRDHQWRLLADSPLRPPAWTDSLLGDSGTGSRLEVEGRGSWVASGSGEGAGKRWLMQGLQLRGGARDARGNSRPWLLAQDVSAELQLDAQGRPLALRASPGRLQVLSTALRWQQAEWQAASAAIGPAARLNLSAELERLDLASVLKRLQPAVGWGGDLSLSGRIEVHAGERFDADVALGRADGDLSVTDELGITQPLGLSELRLVLGAHDGVWQFAQGLSGVQIGQMAGAQVIRTTPGARWPAAGAPLQGVVEASVANLGVWGLWVPPGWRLAGSLHTSASIAGNVGAPTISGRMQGKGLGARNLLQGIVLSDGELDLALEGDRARVDRLSFKGGDGRLEITGDATLGATPSARLKLLADHFRLLGRIDRRVVASGQAIAELDAQRLKLDGRFVLDEGLIDVSQGDAPELDSDVRVLPRAGSVPVRNADERPAVAPMPTPLRNAQVAVVIDLGKALRLRGRGIDTGVVGELQVSSPGGLVALNGTVRADHGSYVAYGQKLAISRGDIVFTGPAGNPRLDVLATRPNLDVEVGVAITGTAQAPRIRLVSQPEMADIDKLSWLVLGRSPDGLGRTDTALLQRAAIALLAGEGKAPTDEFLGRLGLTDFSVRQTEGTVRETIVSLGKQLSSRWYVGYERSLNATSGTWQLIYRVAQRFTLRAQTGETTAFDLIWQWRFN
jgi:translocation and assembly module TamB